ncbi:dimethylamine monooxygenase subunit DmmA family protein [Defluviimonas sp. D31]|uniref:dimethylamine monooxygenase subunit DmmA family protein n=1 Tax=Defluviimonas sp. D31 TaxID=3083253 RepID=UPI00296ED5F3|nr:dimethylamine monooxygenase subunit DmmA family protein [Defluviimonas sp. D31]MDW4551403.1 dimethylamine monooxygenase subunit DmmA family protein [Defluviimonas sp. D31]
MIETTITPSIASRPVYSRLEPRPGKAHLLIADAEGAEAILALAEVAPRDFFAQAHIIHIRKTTAGTYTERLRGLKPSQFYSGPTYEAAVPRIRRTLLGAHMGLQVYLAGTESLMGQAMQEAAQAGIPYGAIQAEHRGSTARRMQCVHCKGITEDVTTDPFVCSHCGLHLFVRDHYSRRLAAFQGVRVDAEDPGNIPEPVERFR